MKRIYVGCSLIHPVDSGGEFPGPDTGPEQDYDDVVRLGSFSCETPDSLKNLAHINQQ